jgi:hypothetical protein
MLQAGTFNGERMQTEQLTWHYDGTTIELGADWSGQGPLVLLLPALSSISTRREMGPLRNGFPRITRRSRLTGPDLAIGHALTVTGGLKFIPTS